MVVAVAVVGGVVWEDADVGAGASRKEYRSRKISLQSWKKPSLRISVMPRALIGQSVAMRLRVSRSLLQSSHLRARHGWASPSLP